MSEEYKKDIEDRKKREEFFSEALTKERIETMTEFELGEMITNLWAIGFWTNKEYIVQKIIADNGLDKIKRELKNLFMETIYLKKDLKDLQKISKDWGHRLSRKYYVSIIRGNMGYGMTKQEKRSEH